MKVKVVDLTRTYQVGSSQVVAVDNVNLEIDEARLVAIVGPSGSGKSTLLNLMGLNDQPTSGKVFIDGTDAMLLPDGGRRGIRLLRMGFIFQTFNLLAMLSALENVELPMALARKTQEEQRRRAERLLEAVGLGKRILHRPKELSMGEMQRVAIARALANDPELIFADEPTGELDSKTARETIALLSGIAETEKKSVIVATHDEKIVDVAETVYSINDGKLKLHGH